MRKMKECGVESKEQRLVQRSKVLLLFCVLSIVTRGTVEVKYGVSVP